MSTVHVSTCDRVEKWTNAADRKLAPHELTEDGYCCNRAIGYELANCANDVVHCGNCRCADRRKKSGISSCQVQIREQFSDEPSSFSGEFCHTDTARERCDFDRKLVQNGSETCDVSRCRYAADSEFRLCSNDSVELETVLERQVEGSSMHSIDGDCEAEIARTIPHVKHRPTLQTADHRTE